MNIREYLRARRQRKARRRYEWEKARREAANDPNAMERVKGAAGTMGSGIGGAGGSG